MAAPPDVAPFADTLADLTRDLRRGCSCLVVCDKGWTLPLFVGLKERLRAADVKCGYLDGRVKDKDAAGAEGGVMLAAVAQMRWAARAAEAEGVVFALPHLDIMTAVEGGWTSISREVIPLLYENYGSIWLGFQDPTVQLPALVEKVFSRRYVLPIPYRALETVTFKPAPKEDALAQAPVTAANAASEKPAEPPRPGPDAVRYPWEPQEGAEGSASQPEPPDEPTSSPADPG